MFETVTLQLPIAVVSDLRLNARAEGLTIEEYVGELIDDRLPQRSREKTERTVPVENPRLGNGIVQASLQPLGRVQLAARTILDDFERDAADVGMSLDEYLKMHADLDARPLQTPGFVRQTSLLVRFESGGPVKPLPLPELEPLQ